MYFLEQGFQFVIKSSPHSKNKATNTRKILDVRCFKLQLLWFLLIAVNNFAALEYQKTNRNFPLKILMQNYLNTKHHCDKQIGRICRRRHNRPEREYRRLCRMEHN